MWGSSSLVQPVEVINGGRHIAQFSALLLCKLDLNGSSGQRENLRETNWGQPLRASWNSGLCVAWSSGPATLELQKFHCGCP